MSITDYFQEDALAKIPHRLKAARKARGYGTRRSFAVACKIPPPTYLNHEEGKSELRVSQLLLYAKTLDISILWLMLGYGHPLDHHPHPDPAKLKVFEAYLKLLEVENDSLC